MNTELLINLYKVFSPSKGEKKMRKFIKNYVRSIPGATIKSDNGNIYVTRGESDTYPCVVAHMDQVQHHTHSKDFDCIVYGDIVMGFSRSSMQQQGLGADDKNGIWVALECLAKYDVFKCAFFWGEEIGCCGSANADMAFFKDVRYVLQCDRCGSGDFITSISGQIASDEFIDDCHIQQFGYHEQYGAMTDVEQLCDNGIGISCVNMSCGYYFPHTDNEVTNLSDLENCLHLVEHIIENCTKRYEFEDNMFIDDYFDFTPRTRDESSNEDADYDEGQLYAELFDIVDTALMYNPDMTADEIIKNYYDYIPTRGLDLIDQIYEDVVGFREFNDKKTSDMKIDTVFLK